MSKRNGTNLNEGILNGLSRVWGSQDEPEKVLVGNAAASTGCVERHERYSCDKVREDCISVKESIGRGAQLRLSSRKPKNGQSSWPDLELMGKEDLIMKIKKRL